MRSYPWYSPSLALLALLGCATDSATRERSAPLEAQAMQKPMDLSGVLPDLEKELVQKYGAPQEARIKRGLRQAASLWQATDGDFAAFAKESFIGDPKVLDSTFTRLEAMFEQLDGTLNEIGRELRRPTDLDVGPLLPVDSMFAGFDVGAHLTADLFQNKIAFVVLLNFPLTDLAERIQNADKYSRREWAEIRLAQRFGSRVPAEIRQEITKVGADADLYISQYNIWMHHLVDAKGERLFPKGKRLISHWNLRDELKAQYSDPNGLPRQRMIIQVMERIVTQTIPAIVIDNPRVDWNPVENTVSVAPAAEVEEDASAREAKVDTSPEPNIRYGKLLAQYTAARKADPYYPTAPTAIKRSFELGQELPEDRVRGLLVEILSSPLVPKVAKAIEAKLGRPLEPVDLWYAGFKPKPKMSESELDAQTKKRYPDAAAFASDMPRILKDLGFPGDRADYIAKKVVVDPSRGAGHAMQAMRRGDYPHLRTRIEKDGMNYKGYNIAVHEFGHNVEQVLSLYDVDHTLLQGVPNTAFTEALAFVFQARDLELLGLVKKDPEAERMRVLGDFWATFEIAGVAIVDCDVWHWMYDHPNATPAELNAATQEIARKIWNQYYAPVLGGKDTPLLGIYSHMISYPLYLSNYVLGHLIAFQIEEVVDKAGKVGPEFERVAKFGAVLPDNWMVHASGAPVGAGPLLRSTERALAGNP
ncbi:MAG: hypothetical protein U1E65_10365 [Myxococcota bacterium]